MGGAGVGVPTGTRGTPVTTRSGGSGTRVARGALGEGPEGGRGTGVSPVPSLQAEVDSSIATHWGSKPKAREVEMQCAVLLRRGGGIGGERGGEGGGGEGKGEWEGRLERVQHTAEVLREKVVALEREMRGGGWGGWRGEGGGGGGFGWGVGVVVVVDRGGSVGAVCGLPAGVVLPADVAVFDKVGRQIVDVSTVMGLKALAI